MHTSLAQVVSEVKGRIKTADRISLFLDFDADPTVPQLDPGTAETLKLLSSQDSLVTTIISGRAVEDLFIRIRLQGLIYAGNHGLEIFGRNLRFVDPAASARRQALEQLCEQLSVELQQFAGVLVEFKGLTASIHYRQAEPSLLPAIETAVRWSVARMGALFRVNPGRKIFEIMPRTSWHKGTAVRWINRHLGEDEVLSIYLGDDTSDEEAFRVLPDAITIKVGNSSLTCARYQLPDPAAVHEFLLWLSIQEAARPRRV